MLSVVVTEQTFCSPFLLEESFVVGCADLGERILGNIEEIVLVPALAEFL